MGDSVHESEMAFVNKDIVFSSDFGGELVVHNRPPIKEILLAFGLLTLGIVGIVLGSVLVSRKGAADQARGIVYIILGALLFLPGFYESRIAYYAYKGYTGFSFSNIPHV